MKRTTYTSPMLYFLVLTFALSFQLKAETNIDPNFSLQIDNLSTSSEKNYLLRPPEKHHFNMQAPNAISKKDGSSSSPIKLSVTEKLISAKIKITPTCQINFKIYVCDDANTYCLPKEKTLSCKTDQEMMSDENKKISDDNHQIPAPPSAILNNNTFIVNDPQTALLKAKVENKPILINFYGSWCPPCNVLDETIFDHPKFKSYKDKMVYLKLDSDTPTSWNLKSKFQVKGYPTVIFASPTNDEIYRVIGSLNPNSFFKKMDFVLKNKNTSIKDLLIAFNKNKTAENAWKLIDSYNNQENYVDAYKVLPFALKKPTLTTKQQDLLQYIPLKATYSLLAKENKSNLVDFIKNSIESYPLEETFLDKLNILDTLAEENKDESLKKWVSLQTLKITNDLMIKKISEDSFISQIDILFIRADAFEKLGSKTEAQFVYRLAAQEIEKQIKKYKLDMKTNRGFNLDRIYAIYKSGDFQTANKLYKDLISVYPQDFTFYYNFANVLKEIGDHQEALTQAQKALEFSYGDNKLRAAQLTAELLILTDKKSEAIKVTDEAIKTAQLPEDKSIRTNRYYKKLTDLKEKLDK